MTERERASEQGQKDRERVCVFTLPRARDTEGKKSGVRESAEIRRKKKKRKKEKEWQRVTERKRGFLSLQFSVNLIDRTASRQRQQRRRHPGLSTYVHIERNVHISLVDASVLFFLLLVSAFAAIISIDFPPQKYHPSGISYVTMRRICCDGKSCMQRNTRITRTTLFLQRGWRGKERKSFPPSFFRL